MVQSSMGAIEKVRRKKSGDLDEALYTHKGKAVDCERVYDIEVGDGVEPVEELCQTAENHTKVCVDVEKKKHKKRKKGKEKIIGLCNSLESCQCIKRNSREEIRRDSIEEKRSGDSLGTVSTVSEAGSDAHTELCLEVKRRKSKRRNGKEKSELCNSLESKDIGQDLHEENGDSSKGTFLDEFIQATNIVPEAKNDVKKGVFLEFQVHGNLGMSSKENRAQVCLKDYKRKSKRKKAMGKSDLAASKESKHDVHNLLEDNADVSGAKSSDASAQGAKTVLEDNTNVQEGLLLELQEHKRLGTPSKKMGNDKNVCLKIYKRKSKRKKAKGKIELSKSLRSKHVEQNLPEEHRDMIVEKSYDECILGTSIVHDATNEFQEGLLPNIKENGKRNEGLSLSKVREVAESSLSLSARNMNLNGASSDLCASIGRVPLSNIGKTLLVLDLNGILVDIVSSVPKGKGFRGDTRISKKDLFKRPFCDDFLTFCFENFNIGVWSSRLKRNVDRVVDYVMGDRKNKLLFCWDQSYCTHTGYATLEDSRKPLVLKELRKLWDKHDPDLPWELGEYNQSNTLLLDDSPYKALRNPPNNAVFPVPYSFLNQNDNSLGPEGDLRVYLERLAIAEDVQKYVEQHPFGQRPISSKNPSWNFYLKIVQQEQSCESTTTTTTNNNKASIPN